MLQCGRIENESVCQAQLRAPICSVGNRGDVGAVKAKVSQLTIRATSKLLGDPEDLRTMRPCAPPHEEKLALLGPNRGETTGRHCAW